MRKTMLIVLLPLLFTVASCTKTTTTTTTTEKATTTTTTSAATTTATTATTAVPVVDPSVTDSSQNVVDFEGYTVNKGQLYELMKQEGGLTVLLNQVDQTILSDYRNQVDMASVNAKIASLQATEGTDTFYSNLIKNGVILSQNDPNLTQEIQNYYIVPFLQQAYATDVASSAITQTDINNAINNYHEDTCIIALHFDTKAQAQAEEQKLSTLTASEVGSEFASQYSASTDSVSMPEQTVEPFLNSDAYSCDYYHAVYDNYSSSTSFRDYLFNSSFTPGTYNTVPLMISPNYYIIYKVSSAPAKTTYDTAAFSTYLKNRLVQNTVTSDYITSAVETLRSTDQFKIYDSGLSALYTKEDPNYTAPQLPLNADTVASFTTDGGKTVQTITADDLYNLLKPGYAVRSVLGNVNYAALTSVSKTDGFAFTDSDLQTYTNDVAKMKSTFLSNGYDQYISWSDYILAYYGASSDDDLAQMLALGDLIGRYVLGYDSYAGVNPVTVAELSDAYNNWFQYQASEIFFSYNPSDQASNDLAQLKANEIIHGCTQDEINTSTCYIKYDSTTKTGGTGDYFTAGLDGTSAADLPTVFAALAKAYSEDTGTAANGGDVGTFGPGQMTADFTAAVQSILTANNGLAGGYSSSPVYDEVTSNGTTVYGYHVIYVTGNTAKVPIPTTNLPAGVNADNIFTASSLSALGDVTDDTAIQNFYTLVSDIKSGLGTGHESSSNISTLLGQLRNNSGFAFLDQDIESHYEAYQNNILK